MNSDILFKLAFPAINIVIGVFFIFVALKTLIGRRPLLLSSRYLFAVMCLAFLPTIANSIVMGLSSSHTIYIK